MPIFHVYFAEKWINTFENYGESEKRAFILGTLFPDIRYLNTLPRDKTHDFGVTREDLFSIDDPFLKGKKFHSLIDDLRAHYLYTNNLKNREFDEKAPQNFCSERVTIAEKQGTSEEKNSEEPSRQISDSSSCLCICPSLLKNVPEEHKTTFLKLLEDEVLYPKQKWDSICKHLQTIDEEELQWGVSEKVIEKWHQILTNYFSSPPSILLEQLSHANQGFMHVSSDLIKTWSTLLPLLSKEECVKKSIFALLDQLDSALFDFDP